MEVRNKISGTAIHSVTQALLFISMFTLVLVDMVNISTISFMCLGVALLLNKNTYQYNYKWIVSQPLFLTFTAFYLLQVWGYFQYPAYSGNDFALQQKVSFIIIPLLLYITLKHDQDNWRLAIKGYIYGVLAAALYCFFAASFTYYHTHDSQIFFYHHYSTQINLNAIYFSLHLLIALGYIIAKGRRYVNKLWLRIAAGSFLYINLLLLSSKATIITGSLLLIMLALRNVRSTILRWTIPAFMLGACMLLALFSNPIKKRYEEVNFQNATAVLHQNNFKNFPFDGLNFRLLLWRMGGELIRENGKWASGLGGKHYHILLNEKVRDYHLYTGNGTEEDTGYLDYDMHNQFVDCYVQFGIIGLLLLVAMLGYLVVQSLHYNADILLFITLLFAATFLTESVLETQSGILLFTIIISGEWIQFHQKRLEGAI